MKVYGRRSYEVLIVGLDCKLRKLLVAREVSSTSKSRNAITGRRNPCVCWNLTS